MAHLAAGACDVGQMWTAEEASANGLMAATL